MSDSLVKDNSPIITHATNSDDTESVGFGREHLHNTLRPHKTYEGIHRYDPSAEWTPAEEKRVIRKTDGRLLTWLCLMFFALQLDRANIANALADNLLGDLGMNTDDYNDAATIQLVFFLAAEFPMQLVIKRYGFKYVLPSMMCAWSLVAIFQAFSTNKISFFVCRALIGVFEGGFIPGAILLASYFYTSLELSVRLATFWCTLGATKIVSALLGAGLLLMRGVGGKPGWFWMLVVEGLLTLVIGVSSYIYLPLSPTTTKGFFTRRPWYTEREEVILVNRILRDDPAKGLTELKEAVTFADIKKTWSDKTLWGLYFIGIIAFIPTTPIMAYFTLILKNLKGFTPVTANLMTAPSAILGILTSWALAYSSDRFNEKTFHCIIGQFWVFPLLVALITLPDGGREWSRFSILSLLTAFPYSHPLVSSWVSVNSFDVKKRAIATATYNVFVQFGSLIGSQIYRSWDAPYYKHGNAVCVSILGVTVLSLIAQRQYLVYLNKKKTQQWNVMTNEEKLAYQMDKEAREADGNKRIDFLYQI